MSESSTGDAGNAKENLPVPETQGTSEDKTEKTVPDAPAQAEPVPKTAAEDSTKSKPPRSSVNVSLEGGSAARDIRIGDQEVTQIRNIFINKEDQAVRAFSVRMAEVVPTSEEERTASEHLHDYAVTSGLLEILLKRRVLVIASDPDSGKAATSLLLAHELKRKDLRIDRATLRVYALDAQTRIDLRRIAKDRKAVGGRVVLFKDVLARDNHDLRAFLSSLDEGSLERFQGDLAASESYAILTADTYSLANLEQRLVMQGVCVRLPALSPALLREGLNRELQNSPNAELVTSELIDQILGHAQSMPRIVRFTRNYLTQVLAGGLSVEEAFGRLDNISLWFFSDLSEDFEAWCFAFTLTLSLAVNPGDGVPWTEFQALRKELVAALRVTAGFPKDNGVYRKDRVSEDTLLGKTRSVIYRDLTTERDTLRFEDTTYAGRLWAAVLGHSHQLITEVFPKLSALVENADRSQLGLRIRAAQAMGRIGEIDPDALTIPIIRKWAEAESTALRAACGTVLQGALSSPNRGYRDRCLAELDRMAAADVNSPRDRDVLWTAINMCKQIGVLDLTLALRKLRMIVEGTLARTVMDLHEMERHLQEIKLQFERRRVDDVGEAAALAVVHRLIRDWAKAVYHQQAPVLYAVQYAAVALCIIVDPIRTMQELRHWLMGSDGLRAVAVIIYLQSGGIADEVNSYVVELPDTVIEGSSATVRVSPFIAALVANPEASGTFGEFLVDLFMSFYQAFPLEAARYLRESFFDHLRVLAKQASPYAPGLSAVEDVFVWLLTSPGPDLKTQLLEVLTTDTTFLEPGSSLQQFARNVRRRALTERRRVAAPLGPFVAAPGA